MGKYEELKSNLAKGWNTWNTRSVLSHVLLPEGLALNLCIKEYENGFYLKEALIGKKEENEEKVYPVAHAYDGSYTELKLNWNKIEIIVQSAVIDEDLILLITPFANQKKPSVLVIEGGILWGKQGYVVETGGELSAVFNNKTVKVYTTNKSIQEVNVTTQTPYIAMIMNEKIGISTGKKRSLEEIETIVREKKAKHNETKVKYGELAEAYNAIQTCLAWDTIYDPSKGRVISPVSRRWNINHGGYVLFCWDTYFAAYMIAIDNKELAYANAIEITREKTEKGFVPNFANGIGIKSRDRSQPPVGSLVIRELYRRYKEKWLLQELFEDLYDWNCWFYENRHAGNGLLAWGSSPYEPTQDNCWETIGVNESLGGALESGLDNSPMYDDIPFNKETHLMELADVGLTSLYVMDCKALADIAEIIGREAEAAQLKYRAKLCNEGLSRLWDPKTGIYLNKRTDTDEFSLKLSPTNFYPLICKNPDENQVITMMEKHFFNPEEFWGDWIIPSISRNDPSYKEQDYWRGRIWAPLNFLVYLGLRNYNLPEARRKLVEKSKELLMKEWKEHGHIHENYNADTGVGCDKPNSDGFYHWGALLAFMCLMEEGFVDGTEDVVK